MSIFNSYDEDFYSMGWEEQRKHMIKNGLSSTPFKTMDEWVNYRMKPPTKQDSIDIYNSSVELAENIASSYDKYGEADYPTSKSRIINPVKTGRVDNDTSRLVEPGRVDEFLNDYYGDAPNWDFNMKGAKTSRDSIVAEYAPHIKDFPFDSNIKPISFVVSSGYPPLPIYKNPNAKEDKAIKRISHKPVSKMESRTTDAAQKQSTSIFERTFEEPEIETPRLRRDPDDHRNYIYGDEKIGWREAGKIKNPRYGTK